MSGTVELGKTIKAKADAVSAIFATADKDTGGVCKPEQVEEIKKLNHEIEEMEVSYKSLVEQDNLRGANKSRHDWLNTSAGGHSFGGGDIDGAKARVSELKSFGDVLTQNDNFKDWLKSVAPNGQISKEVKIQSVPVEFRSGIKSLMRYGGGESLNDAAKTLITGSGSTSGGPFINIDYRGLLDKEGVFHRPLKIVDLCTVLQTNSDTIEYPRLGTPTNAAATVAEATATGGASGQKSESTFPTSTITDTIKTIAHWIPASRRALADGAQLGDIIDSFLRYGLAEELEDQIIAGGGTGEDFTGILSVSGIQTQAYVTSELVSTRKGLTLAQKTGRVQPNAYVFHPDNWETMDLLKDNEARYYFGGPMVEGAPRLWGVPVIVSEAMTTGYTLLGDFRYAVLWDRMQTAIYMSDSHSDFFTRNLIAILAELRAGFGCTRPSAFVKVDIVA